MKSKNTPVTLQSLARLINEKFGMVDKRFNFLDSKIIGIYGELDGVKQEVRGHQQEAKTGFDGVYDGLSEIASTIDHNVGPRLKRLEDKVFA